MAAIVSGNSLGLSLTSLATLGQRGSLGLAQQGRNGEQSYVNVANGNLVLQDRDDVLVGRGLDLNVLRTYNSQGLLNGDNSDNWTLGVEGQRIKQTGPLAQAGSTLTRTDRDGAQAVYTWDSARSLYVGTAGAGAHDTVAYDAAALRFTWTDGSTGVLERYESTGQGRLLSAADAAGNALTYTYNTSGALQSMVDANGETTYFDYTDTNFSQIRTVASDGTVLTRVRYAYDASNRLSMVSVDLSPEDNSVADGKTYVTTYAYDGGSKRVAGITQSDGTSLAFTYVKVGNDYRVSSIRDGLNQVTSYAYDTANRRTTVTDPLGLVTVYSYDVAGQLTQIKSPAVSGVSQVTAFTYDTNGDVTQVVDAEGRAVVMTYDARGNQLLQRDAAGNTVTRTYDARNQLSTETVYLTPDPDGAGAGQPAQPLTTRYVYDAANKNLLRFTLSAEGRVSEHRYDSYGQRTSTIQYAAAAYDTAALATTVVPTEAQMSTWVDGQDKARTLRTDLSYDARGQLQRQAVYAAVSADGSGIADGTQSVTQYVYDRAGLLLSTVSATNGSTRYAYDGLGRVLSTQDALAQTTFTSYDDANNKTSVTLANGLITTSAFDRAGRLTHVLQSSAQAANLGATQYFYDADGRLRMTQDPTGVRAYMLYDEAGRLVADIDGDGSLTEYSYDKNNLLTRTVAYANAVSPAALASLVDGSGRPTNVALSGVRPAASGADLKSFRAYDGANRLVRLLENTSVTETVYDGASRVVAVTRRATEIVNTAAFGTAPTVAQLTPAASAGADRVARHFYDSDGLLRASLDGEGYLTEYRYDAAGRKTQALRYATATDAALRVAGTLAQLLPAAAAEDIQSFWFYDARGLLVAEVDGEQYLTEHVYDADGRLAQTVRYANRVGVPVAPTSTLAQLRPAASAQDQGTLLLRDALGRVTQETDAQGTVTQYGYNSVGQLIRTDRAVGTGELRTLLARYDLQGRLTGELTAEGAALLTGGQTQAQIDAIWVQYGLFHTYDAAGRRTGTTDQNGQATLFFYNVDGQLTHTVNALGEVQERQYDALGQLVASRRYGTRISLAGLTGTNAGGLVNANLAAAINAVRNPAVDSTESYTYLLNRALGSTIDAEGATRNYAYNAFGEMSRAAWNAGALERRQSFSYDRRGLLVEKQDQDSGSGALAASATVYDAFGRVSASRASSETAYTYAQYDRLGRVVQVQDPLAAVRSSTYDAFDRVLTHTDALGQTTRYGYDTALRSLTVTTPEGVAVTTTYSRHGQVQSVTDGRGNTTRYTYDRNGNLVQTQAPLATSGSVYDRADRLVRTTNANGTHTDFSYDAANRLLTRTLDAGGLNLTSSYQYDAKGQRVRFTDANGVVSTTEFDRKGQVVRQTVDPAGLNLQTVYSYDTRGNTLSVTSPGGVLTRYTYDSFDRRVREQVDPDGLNLARSYEYDVHGNLRRTVDANGNATRYAYDAKNRLVFTLDPLGGLQRNTYDAENRIVQTVAYASPIDTSGLSNAPAAVELEARIASNPAQDLVQFRRFDKDGRLRFTVDGIGAVIEYRTDGNGNIIEQRAYAHSIDLASWNGATDPAPAADDARDVRSRKVYDAANRLTWSVNGVGAVTHNVYDAVGNVTEQRMYARAIDPATAADDAAMAGAVAAITDDARDARTRNIYDKANRLAWQADGTGAVSGFAYDANGNLLRRVQYATAIASDASPASAAASGTDRITAMAYDAAGRRTFVVDASGSVSRTSYDAFGNVTRVLGYANGIAPPGAAALYTDAALQAAVAANDSSNDRIQRFAYDAANRQVLAVDALGAVTESVYDGAGNKTLGRAYATRLDTAGLGATASAADIRSRLAADAANDRIVRHAFDAAGRRVYSVDALGHVGKSSYDAIGRTLSTTEYALAIPAGTANTVDGIAAAVVAHPGDRTRKQAFDSAGHLLSSVDAMGFTEAWSYDAVGNKASYTNAKGAVWTYVHDAAGRLTQETSPAVDMTAVTQDGAGKLVVDAAHSGVGSLVTSLAYDALGNLRSRTEALGRVEQRTTSYEYDAAGRQVKVIYPPVGVYTGAEDITINGAEGVAVRVDATQVLFTQTTYDALGNAVANRDVAGNYSYKAYDLLGRVAYDVDVLGFATGYQRNAFGDVENLTRYGATTGLAAGHPASLSTAQVRAALNLQDTTNRTILTDYDRLGRAIQVTEPIAYVHDNSLASAQGFMAGKTTRNTYNTFGELAQVAQLKSAGNWTLTSHFYDRRGQQVASVDALGYLTTQAFDGAGNLAVHTEYAKAAAGWAGTGSLAGWTGTVNAGGTPPAAVADAANDRRTETAYDRNNRKTSETRKNVEYSVASNGTSTRGDLTTSYGYDAVGNLTRTTDAAGASTYSYYDALGRATAVAEPTRTSTVDGSALTPLTVFRRDAYGNVVMKTEYVNGADANGAPLAPSSLPPYALVPNPEVGLIEGSPVWAKEGSVGYIASAPFAGGTALYRINNQLFGKHLYTTSLSEYQSWLAMPNVVGEGIQGYVATTEQPGSVRLYRLTSAQPGFVDVVYTTSLAEVQALTTNPLYPYVVDEGQPAYIGGSATGPFDAQLTRYVGPLTSFMTGFDHLYLPDRKSVDAWSDADTLARTDRTSYAQYDALGHTVQSTDAMGVNHYSSYNSQGLIAKEWQGVTDNEGATRTLYRAYQYDALGRQTHVLDPGTPSDNASYVNGGAAAGGAYSASPGASVTQGAYEAEAATESSEPIVASYGKLELRLTNTVNVQGGAFQVQFDFVTPDRELPGDENTAASTEPGHAATYAQTFLASAAGSPQGVALTPDEPIGTVTAIRVLQQDAAGNWVLLWQGTPAQATGQVVLSTGASAPSAVVDTALQYNAFGELVAKGVNGQAGEYFDYDNAGRLWRTNAGDGVDKVALYDLQGRQTAEVRSAGQGHGNLDMRAYGSAEQAANLADVRRTETTYDLLGHVTRQTLAQRSQEGALDAARPIVNQNTDRWGNVLSISDPRSANWVTTYSYNANNQLIRQVQTDADGNAGADASGNIVNPNAVVTSVYYDQMGRQVAVRDANDHVNGQVWDAGGHLVQELHADGGVISHAYDAFGDKVRTLDAMGHGTWFTHDKLDRLLRTTHGAVDIWGWPTLFGPQVTGHAQTRETSAYDQTGRLLRSTNGAGETLKYAYDLRGNLIKTTRPMGQTVQAAYDALNRKTIEVDANGALATWKYTYFGQLAGHSDIGGANYAYSYDNARQLTQQTSTRGQNLAYSHDAAGQLVRIDDAGVGKTSTYAYDLSGRRLRETTVQGGVTYQDNHIAYDALGRMRWVADTRAYLSIDYDKVGNRTHIGTRLRDEALSTQQVPTAVEEDSQRYFQYDAMNRQTVVDAVDANGSLGTEGHRLTYDLNGNRASDTRNGIRIVEQGGTGSGQWVAEAGESTEVYGYDALNRLTSTVRDGALVDSRGYDGANRVVSSGPGAVGVDYINLHRQWRGTTGNDALQGRQNLYDANGQLVHQKTLEYLVAGSAVNYEYDAAGNVLGYLVADTVNNTFTHTANTVVRAEGYRTAMSFSATTAAATGALLSQGGLGYGYDANGHLNFTGDSGQMSQPTLRTHNFVNDASGNALYAYYAYEGAPQTQANQVNGQRQLIVNGEVLGRYGLMADHRFEGTPLAQNGPFFSAQSDFSFGYQPIDGNYPAGSPGTYAVGAGDTLQSIAKGAYGDASLWYLIADANGLSSNADLRTGQVLTISTRVASANNAGTFKPYDPSKIASDTPTMMAAPQAQDGGCGAIGQIIMVVVAVIVTIYTAGAAGAYFGAAGAAGAGGFAGGVAVLGGAGGLTAASIGAAVVGGAVGSIASQAVGVAIGAQDEFSWKGVALGAIGAGVSAGVGAALGPVTSTGFDKAMTLAGRGALTGAITQGISVATGLQNSFSWRSVAASAVGAGVGSAVSDVVGPVFGDSPFGQFATRATSGFAAGVTAAAMRGGRVSVTQVATDAFGNALGDSIAEANGQGVPGPVGAAERASIMRMFADGPGTEAQQNYANYQQLVGAFSQGSSNGDRYPGAQYTDASGMSSGIVSDAGPNAADASGITPAQRRALEAGFGPRSAENAQAISNNADRLLAQADLRSFLQPSGNDGELVPISGPTQGVGPWSEKDYRNGSDIQDDLAIKSVAKKPSVADNTKQVYSLDNLAAMPTWKIQGAGDPELAGAMTKLQGERAKTTGEWTPYDLSKAGDVLATVARVRGVSLETVAADYQTTVDLINRREESGYEAGQKRVAFDELNKNEHRVPLLSMSAANGLPDNSAHMASIEQLRFGKMVGDALGGLDPVFGALLSPTGGIPGAGNVRVTSSTAIAAAGGIEVVTNHGIAHDAAGYLLNYQGMGPGYQYVPGNSGLFFSTKNPLGGQVPGLTMYNNVRLYGTPTAPGR
jgi:YD repeat-containing protein